MLSRLVNITFIAIDEGVIIFEASDESDKVAVQYEIGYGRFHLMQNNSLSAILSANLIQLQKVIRSFLKGDPAPGQSVHAVFIQDFPFLSGNDYCSFIQIDRRGIQPDIRVSSLETPDICRLYTDGSYAHETDRSAYAGIIIGRNNHEEHFENLFFGGSSSLMELMAVCEGLKRVGKEKMLQINTDSRFVIRGLAQWIHFWRLNDYHMAYGRKVRYADQWQQIDALCEGRLLEFKWIKAHSSDKYHLHCHFRAKELATKGKTGVVIKKSIQT